VTTEAGTGNWSTPTTAVAAAWVAAALAAVWCVLGTEAAGQMIAAVTTVVLFVLALHGTVARPRLAAGPTGLAVRGLLGRREWPWTAVQNIRVVRTRRLGREVPVLEIDATDPDGTEHLVVLTRLDLGAEPEDVADDLHRLRTY